MPYSRRSAFGAMLVLMAALFAAGAASAADPLVDSQWVRNHLEDENVVFLDTRLDSDAYEKAHVPGALHTHYIRDDWRVTRRGVPGQLPSEAEAAVLLGGLGIENDSTVVLIPAGKNATEVGIATRIYWTLRAMGHEDVSLLDGGMRSWTSDKDNPVESGINRPTPALFEANLQREFVALSSDVRLAIETEVALLVDHRPERQYTGSKKVNSVAKPGTIPGARNVPAMALTDPETGKFKSSEELAKLFEDADASSEKPVIHFCNTGHWATVGWFAYAEILGNDGRVYDGSMAEWSRDDANSVDCQAC